MADTAQMSAFGVWRQGRGSARCILVRTKLRRVRLKLLFLTLAAWVAYAPSLTIPLIADDYPNLTQAQSYGSPSGLPVLMGDAQFRLRSTSYWTMCGLWQVAGVRPLVYHLASLLLHTANVWLVYFVALAWPRMRSGAFWGALLFAVHEGHQEAVMWFSAINELLVFFFGMASLLCWLKAGSGGKRTWRLEWTGTLLFALALFSKESAVVLLPLFLLTLAGTFGDGRPGRLRLLPLAALVALALASIAASRSNSFRFSDGSFSWTAPFWVTWPVGLWRVLWIWGLPAIVLLAMSRDRAWWRPGLLAMAWIGIGLLPYSFLTYSSQIPSRQTYLASAGLGWLAGLAVAYALERWPRRRAVAMALVGVMVCHNVVYLWTKKRAQFLDRAAPTEQLIAFARRTPGDIWVKCFPQPPIVAEEAVHLAVGRSPASLVWNEAGAMSRSAVVFCYRAR